MLGGLGLGNRPFVNYYKLNYNFDTWTKKLQFFYKTIAMSSLESLSSSNEGSYGCPDYEIEDETFEITPKVARESRPSYVVEEEFIEDEDEFSTPYAEEPLANEPWIEEYHMRKIEK